ncbi:E3 ubiquitin-protein ligase TRIM21-like [Periophthalmus magnuspinnatus]|uniref:E3 ubiquitin-protein ligase TRIM21-like n=1 Tax=Periophthalmus magnuspinnatus TaxID=409849 RepID=UPI00145A87A9|nr:E3 ubiquitin-protein ligase TRIM21-like isoform X2 [Periophthalmus magnuspinnatus]XP_033840002.1 E3 ubiquitin-protein ligase TRIM21-like [Periophthalmus magnuspinnatus]
MSTQPVSVSVSSLWLEEQFKCCICLDIYRDPVSTPCGHNFCLDCIEGYWETKSRPECPLCKETFSSRPELRINHGFKEIIRHFETSLSNPGQDNDPSTFGLTDPATFSTSHLCRRHNKPLEMFCKKDQTPVCSSCTARDHRNHPTVPIDRACKKVKVSLKETKAQIKKMMQERIHKTEEIQQAVDQSKKVMERQIQQSVEVCTMLISAVERQQSTVVEELQRRQEEVEEKANQMINHLQAELKALQTRGIEIVNLQATQNPLEMLQTFPSVNKLPLTQDWTQVKVYPDSGTGAIRDGVTEMIEICQKVSDKLLEEEVEKLSQYALDVTYDPDTASGWLEISADGKQVSLCSQKKKLPVTDNDKRFDSCVCVLGKENFSSGRQYWEVQVGDKTDWDVGVAQESVQRRGSISVRPDAGFWSICRRRGSLGACTSPSLPLPLTPPPQRVGVYVDYEQRCVSFYDAELKKLIYSFTDCDFSGAVVPYFNPCVQDNGKTPPLVICPVVKSTREARKDLIMRTTV